MYRLRVFEKRKKISRKDLFKFEYKLYTVPVIIFFVILVIAWSNRTPMVLPEIYAISLVTSPYRRQNVAKQLYEFDFHLIEGANGQHLTFEQEREADKYFVKTNELTRGHIGCFLSHISVWRKVIQQDAEYALIFEDDLSIDGPLKRLLPKLSHIKNFDIMYLGECSNSSAGHTVQHVGDYTVRISLDPCSLNAYIISKKAAKELLKFIDIYPSEVTVDKFLHRVAQKRALRSLVVTPTLIGSIAVPSLITEIKESEPEAVQEVPTNTPNTPSIVEMIQQQDRTIHRTNAPTPNSNNTTSSVNNSNTNPDFITPMSSDLNTSSTQTDNDNPPHPT